MVPVQALQKQRLMPALVEEEQEEDGRKTLVATVDLPSHTLLGEWTGEVVTKEELRQKLEEQKLDDQRMEEQGEVLVMRMVGLGKDLAIDSSDRGSPCR